MPGCRLPVLNPLLPNAVGLFDERAARAVPVLDYNDNSSVEFPLGVIYSGQTRTFRGNHILDRHLRSFGPEYRMPIRVLTGSPEVL